MSSIEPEKKNLISKSQENTEANLQQNQQQNHPLNKNNHHKRVSFFSAFPRSSEGEGEAGRTHHISYGSFASIFGHEQDGEESSWATALSTSPLERNFSEQSSKDFPTPPRPTRPAQSLLGSVKSAASNHSITHRLSIAKVLNNFRPTPSFQFQSFSDSSHTSAAPTRSLSWGSLHTDRRNNSSGKLHHRKSLSSNSFDLADPPNSIDYSLFRKGASLMDSSHRSDTFDSALSAVTAETNPTPSGSSTSLAKIDGHIISCTSSTKLTESCSNSNAGYDTSKEEEPDNINISESNRHSKIDNSNEGGSDIGGGDNNSNQNNSSDQANETETSIISEENESGTIANNSSSGSSTSILFTMAQALLNRLLNQKTLSDRVSRYHPILAALAHSSPKYTFPIFLAIYLIILLILWLPLWLLAQLLSEIGVYFCIFATIVYGGRCLLRLLAFPGTNVKVYGEMETEFARYSCKMLEGACTALEDMGKGILNWANPASASSKMSRMYGDSVDIPSAYKRVIVYRDRVLGVYWQVLHCLIEENGQGYEETSTAVSSKFGFYRLEPVAACKRTCSRNFCCDRPNNGSNGTSSNNNVDGKEGNEGSKPIEDGIDDSCHHAEGIQLSATNRSLSNSSHDNLSPTNRNDGDDDNSTSPTTCYGNNPLIGDIGNLANVSPQARLDGKELYTLLTTILQDLSSLESSAANVLRTESVSKWKRNSSNSSSASISEESREYAQKLLNHVAELRQLVSRMKPPPSSSSSSNEDDEEEEDMGAEAVRQRLEEHGTASSAASVRGESSSSSPSSSSSTTVTMIKSTIEAFFNMIDPPPHKYIFGLDVIRGCFLARYRGSRQFWVDRSGSSAYTGRGWTRLMQCLVGRWWKRQGMIDVIKIPSSINNVEKKEASIESRLPLSPRHGRAEEIGLSSFSASGTNGSKGSTGRKAVLYCNPNAGLAEVATGMGLIGGNVDTDEGEGKDPTSWTDYYIEHGYDVYLFNYAGYGRSYGGNSWNRISGEFTPGFVGVLRRILFSMFVAFKPSSESLKSDSTAVARYLLEEGGVDRLIIHGESIGGMAAAGAAHALTKNGRNSGISLLLCDRTFCNLEAVAQRLVGGWTGRAIRLLTPTWSTDVACDFIAAKCEKIVANDAADEIIHDYSSLKSGVSFAGELTKGDTNKAGWMMPAPTWYRITDFENVGVMESSVLTCHQVNPPTWPADKHISWTEAFHFAACVRRLGKLATAAKKQSPTMDDLNHSEDVQEGIEVSCSSDDLSTEAHVTAEMDENRNSITKGDALPMENLAIINIWQQLALCDGLCGHPLGYAVKEGVDCTVSWLCCAVVFGGQVVAEAAGRRRNRRLSDSSRTLEEDQVLLEEDFDLRPKGFWHDEDDVMKHPMPIPEVLTKLKEINEQKNLVQKVEIELSYVVGMLEYIVLRITSKEHTATVLKRQSGYNFVEDTISTGRFLKLNCGHNNQYSAKERDKLIALIRKSGGDDSV